MKRYTVRIFNERMKTCDYFTMEMERFTKREYEEV